MKIESFKVDRWSDPDEHHHVKHLGMAKWGETFCQLKKALENMGLLPDEYFLSNGTDAEMETELPDYDFAQCIPNYGESEGIYMDIVLAYTDEDDRPRRRRFATGKTLDESVDAFFRMSITAAVCSLFLNGRGHVYQSDGAVLMLNRDEKAFLNSYLESNAHLFSGVERQDLRSVLDKLQCGLNSSQKAD